MTKKAGPSETVSIFNIEDLSHLFNVRDYGWLSPVISGIIDEQIDSALSHYLYDSGMQEKAERGIKKLHRNEDQISPKLSDKFQIADTPVRKIHHDLSVVLAGRVRSMVESYLADYTLCEDLYKDYEVLFRVSFLGSSAVAISVTPIHKVVPR